MCLGWGGGVVNLRFTPVASHLYKQLLLRRRGVISTIRRKMLLVLFSVFYTPG